MSPIFTDTEKQCTIAVAYNVAVGERTTLSKLYAQLQCKPMLVRVAGLVLR